MSLHQPLRLKNWVMEWKTEDNPSRKYFYSREDLHTFFEKFKAQLPAGLNLVATDDGQQLFGVLNDHLYIAIRIHQMELQDVVRRFRRLVGHMICHSLGYCSPLSAARIILDAACGDSNWCEWIYSCYDTDPRPAFEQAIRTRHRHQGYMANYATAQAIVGRVLAGGPNPELGSWF